VLLGAFASGAGALQLAGMTPEARIAAALEQGAVFHPQEYRSEFLNGASVAWSRLPWIMGCTARWTEESRAEHYQNLVAMDGRIVLAASTRPTTAAGWRARCCRRSMRSSGSTSGRWLHEPTARACRLRCAAGVACAGIPRAGQLGRSLCRRGRDRRRQIYEGICQACHMADARGGGGAGTGIPALADNPRLADKAYAIGILVKGRGGMPWFTDILTPPQIAAVLTYVRWPFQRLSDPVTAAEVERIAGKAGGTAEQ
jgi:hypothetical protein